VFFCDLGKISRRCLWTPRVGGAEIFYWHLSIWVGYIIELKKQKSCSAMKKPAKWRVYPGSGGMLLQGFARVGSRFISPDFAICYGESILNIHPKRFWRLWGFAVLIRFLRFFFHERERLHTSLLDGANDSDFQRFLWQKILLFQGILSFLFQSLSEALDSHSHLPDVYKCNGWVIIHVF